MSNRTINGVSIITSTNKPQYMNNIFDNYSRQMLPNKQLIIILNSNKIDSGPWVEKAKAYPDVLVYQLPESVSLGECLNFAADLSRYNVIAKFDDDDFYSKYYLTSSLRAMRRKNVDMVGKRSVLTYFVDDKTLILRFPGHENSYQSYVAGGTMVFRKSAFQRVRFGAVSLGEDVDFMTRFRRKGFRTFATSRHDYVYMRKSDPNMHTWKPMKSYLLRTGRFIARTTNIRKYVLRKG
ncbi:glycosyltransferase [Paenibacillus harenae]|uniref:glycosyltransferase n=1 Tax=Paenibacillus harenae TaxID=306543 RepID=UPI0027D80CD6|nr:glycosyltransferase [Paenibacillus harenae]